MTILEKEKPVVRIEYDPSKVAHRLVLKRFMETGKWQLHFIMPQGRTNLPFALMEITLKYFFKEHDND